MQPQYEQLKGWQTSGAQYLKSNSPALAAAELQRLVKRIVVAKNAQVVSTQILTTRQDGIATGSDAQPAAAADVQLTRTLYAAPDFEAFSEILERPLFTEGRTPPEPPTAEQAAVSPGTQTKLTMRLEGIALTPEARIAVIRDMTSNKLLRLAEGAEHQGWLVESVHATSATLKRGEQTHELTLELDKRRLRKTSSPARKKRRKK
ncbi:MAG: type II secretion system protein N [Pseudomonadota bacterium]|nr:type II secretion system protein N [Pseudomonadota bacterium]